MKPRPLLIGGLVCACSVLTARAETAVQRTSVAIPVGKYQVAATPQGSRVTVDGYGSLLVPGKPMLPSRIFAIAIPPGAEVVGVTYDAGDGVVLPGPYEIPPVPVPRPIGVQDAGERLQRIYRQNYEQVYGNDDRYPADVAVLERRAGYRKYNLVDVRVAPFSYRARSGRLTFHPQITVHVEYARRGAEADVIVDQLARPEETAGRIVINDDAAAEWYPPAASATLGLANFVIITLDSLTSSVAPLVDWETAKGRTVEVVTTSWIDATYDGFDLAERMRNFLRDKYPSGQWGIEDVLLVGHYDDVPMRRTAQDVGYGQPETDFYYAELSLPDDESWDADVDRQWGEDTDPIDFYAEVNVGRIPWSDPDVVRAICEKSVAYEQNNDPAFKKNAMLLGAFFWNDDPNPRTDTAVLMEAIAAQPWMSDWTITRMYEQNEDCWSSYPCDQPLLPETVMSTWPTGRYAFVNWAGHGSPTSSHIYGLGMPAFIQWPDALLLDDAHPAIIFADACSNSDTDYFNIGQAMIRLGAVGFLGATKVAFGSAGWADPSDGSTQSLDYFFASHVTSGDYTQGQAHQRALLDMYTYGLWSVPKYEVFEWGALLGNPDLAMDTALCPADLSGDGVVDVVDMLQLLAAWGTPQGDLDGDGDTGILDFLALLAAWGSCS